MKRLIVVAVLALVGLAACDEPPGTPTLGALTPGDASITVNWTAATTGGFVSYYQVWRGTAPGNEVQVYNALGNVHQYVDRGEYLNQPLVNGTRYYYKIAAENSTAVSDFSAEDSAIPVAGITHAVVIMEENRTWSNVGTGFSTMPYLHSLGGMYLPDWTETNTSENSLTQYIGLTSGLNDPNSIASDCSPSTSCNTTVDNLFRQGRVAGLTMRSYVEGATTGCSASGNAAKHIPALYYWGGTDRNFCSSEVRPLGELDVNNLPSFAMVTPNLCNDGHDCANSTVDNWLSVHLAPILASTEYQAGHVLVNVLWDEDRPVPNLALFKGIVGGSNAAAGTHNRALATWEDLLSLPRLTTATSLRGVYGL